MLRRSKCYCSQPRADPCQQYHLHLYHRLFKIPNHPILSEHSTRLLVRVLVAACSVVFRAELYLKLFEFYSWITVIPKAGFRGDRGEAPIGNLATSNFPRQNGTPVNHVIFLKIL